MALSMFIYWWALAGVYHLHKTLQKYQATSFNLLHWKVPVLQLIFQDIQ